MADGESWWGGWFQQSFQAVKDKSTEALEFIKRDLTEFSTVVQHDTACSIVATATAVKNKLAVEGSSETTEKVKKSLSSFLGVITDTLAPPPDKTIDCDVITLVATPAGTTEVYDSSKMYSWHFCATIHPQIQHRIAQFNPTTKFVTRRRTHQPLTRKPLVASNQPEATTNLQVKIMFGLLPAPHEDIRTTRQQVKTTRFEGTNSITIYIKMGHQQEL
ncbi:hypothetical protein WMY93_017456 [Mugilogobius chulae]|uniref:BSD domain-containing protein n=1 Tax=Mugilogobius chulae TaxID=88201 RepID=A0AAW0P0E6_9GOBI